jgi:hypothetical protein
MAISQEFPMKGRTNARFKRQRVPTTPGEVPVFSGLFPPDVANLSQLPGEFECKIGDGGTHEIQVTQTL